MPPRSTALAMVLATAGALVCAQEPAPPAPPVLPAVPVPPAALPQAEAASAPFRDIRFDGGSYDDRLVARRALGLAPGRPIGEADKAIALEALKLTDRFRKAEASLEPAAGGVDLHLTLERWPALRSWRFEGDAIPKPLRKTLLPELDKGSHPGDRRVEELRALAETRLREGGYPQASVKADRSAAADQLVFTLRLGAPDLVRHMDLAGDPGPYTRSRLLKVARIEEGRTLWTMQALRFAQRALRQRLIKDKRFEGRVDLAWADQAAGVLRLEIHAGPVVRLKVEGAAMHGAFFGQRRIEDFAPLTKSERYSPEQLDEGDRRLQRYFRDKGNLDAAATHERRVLKGTAERPEEVALVYRVAQGNRFHAAGVRVEGNSLVPDKELAPLAKLPRRWLLLHPWATPDLLKLMEERYTAFYLQRGFPDAHVRLRFEPGPEADSKSMLVQIREGKPRQVASLELLLAADPRLDPMRLGESLAFVLSDRPQAQSQPRSTPDGRRVYTGDRRTTLGAKGTLELLPDFEGQKLVRFLPDRALPRINADLAQVLSELKTRLSSLGAEKPQVRLSLEEGASGDVVRIQVPAQPLDQVRRMVVRGADATRAEAVFREVPLKQGDPVDPARFTESQGNLGELGAFRRTDFVSLADAPGEAPDAFTRGDLGLDLEERRPWVFTEGFGYDKSQGYHFLFGVQRLNVGGMGRTLELGMRAGDNTLNNPTLRRMFPTGDINRSVDSYSLAYTDPWPGFLQNWFDRRIRWRSEGAYIEEATAGYFARRRRFTSAFNWKVSDIQAVEVGYRFERTEIGPNSEGITEEDLLQLARTNKLRAVISAPYVQLVRDHRDRPFDPTSGTFFAARLDLANQLFGTATDSSFVKLDLRGQWNHPIGFRGESGVLTASLRLGTARPTAASAVELPLSERFYGGGPFSVRGVEPDFLGPVASVPLRDAAGNIQYYPQPDPTAPKIPKTQLLPTGGQVLAVANLEYRFPLIGQTIWGEVFVDSGQVYARLNPGTRQPGDPAPFPHWRTTPGFGLIFKLGFPLKVEYAADLNRILGRPRSPEDRETQLKSLLISAGFQF
ncbi:MAG TPA: BamA/TamA family outer membrane protein [Holophagaceae bacterium]|nr:BamA/TamA family outer membrane protein [Holophagaceae bacterium]